MNSTGKPWWQQATALVSLSASGAITGFSFAPAPAAEAAAPTATHIRLLALQQAAQPASAAQPIQSSDATLRSAIVTAARYYLRLAQDKSPAEMEALIWQHDSSDGANHGPSCAAFASLTLELASRVVGQQSWVSGGSSYPWPLHTWADVRVDPNPASPGIMSVLQDAQAHGRWHPLGDRYMPKPGDWVLFSGHVEVVTKYAHGVLSTIGGDSLPNFTVNAHEYANPLSQQGVAGFVNNGDLGGGSGPAADAPGQAVGTGGQPESTIPATTSAGPQGTAAGQPSGSEAGQVTADSGGAAIPGAAPSGSPSAQPPPPVAGSADVPAVPVLTQARGHRGPAHPQPVKPRVRSGQTQRSGHAHRPSRRPPAVHTSPAAGGGASVPGAVSFGPPAAFQKAGRGTAAIPGVTGENPQAPARGPAAPTHHVREQSAPAGPAQLTPAQRAFIAEVTPGAVATQRDYGVPASVTIAQAINESGWGQSSLATKAHNLFGMKGAGPAGSDTQLTEEFENGQWQVTSASFRAYHSLTQSIDDHGRLLATSDYYRQVMAERHDPDAFASALTGVYATDPGYGATLIRLMQEYDLYQYNHAAAAAAAPQSAPAAAKPEAGSASIPGIAPAGPGAPARASRPHIGSRPARPPTPRKPAPGPTSPPRSTRPAPPPATTPPPVVTSPPRTARPSPPSTAPVSPPRGTPPAPPPASPTAPARIPQPAPASSPSSSAKPVMATLAAKLIPGAAAGQPGHGLSAPVARGEAGRYGQALPRPVRNSFLAVAKAPLSRGEPLYQDVADQVGIRWELLAACDWMQCEAKPRHSPVHGERLGTPNGDGTIYWTKSAALAQCAVDLIELAGAVYGIDLTARDDLSVRELANVYAAFRWGGLLKLHRTSAMEFPYSVAGLTVQHISMRWPNIDEPQAPDKPGSRFRMHFGAVPVVLSLNYPATD